MTDERLGDRLWEAIDALPEGAGIVFRHYSLTDEARLELGTRLADVARQRGLLLAVAGSRRLAERLAAPLVHNPDGAGPTPCSLAVHNDEQAMLARSAGAALVFVGPIHPTRSHPGAAVLGEGEAARLAQLAACPAIALGGMDSARLARLQAAHPNAFHGFAGIDCWLGE